MTSKPSTFILYTFFFLAIFFEYELRSPSLGLVLEMLVDEGKRLKISAGKVKEFQISIRAETLAWMITDNRSVWADNPYADSRASVICFSPFSCLSLG